MTDIRLTIGNVIYKGFYEYDSKNSCVTVFYGNMRKSTEHTDLSTLDNIVKMLLDELVCEFDTKYPLNNNNTLL